MREERRSNSVLRLIEQAEHMGISPYKLIKREVHYRQAAGVCAAVCERCENMAVPTFRSGARGMQCTLIGVMDDPAAWIRNGWTCDKWEKRKGV
ncbi:MAG: hypothetical protein WC683_04220 [bacterium]